MLGHACLSVPKMFCKTSPFIVLFLAWLAGFSTGAEPNKSSADWPQWMGPGRDDVWSETGIIEKFSEGGLQFLWRKPINGGFAGPAVANGKVFVTDYLKSSGDAKPDPGKRNDLTGKERVLCLDAKTGNELWKHE